MSLRSLVGSILRRLHLHRLTVEANKLENWARATKPLVMWSLALRRAMWRRARRTLALGDVRDSDIAVIVCLWRRPDRLPHVLRMLAEQATTRTVRLVLWNNKPEYTSRYVRDIEKFGPTGALARIELFESAHNLGGIARFVVGRQIIREGYIGPFITLDDDQDVSPTFVHDLLAAHRPATIAGFWAYAYGADYWDRRALRDGEEASYVGTGGAIFDSAIVSDRTFFTALPPKYGFIEDIWACHRVRRDGGTLRKVDTPVIMVQEELNQHHDLISLKREFVSYLEQHPER